MVKIVDVAGEAGVSPTTVSFILNNKGNFLPATKERVREVCKRMGYTPNASARALRMKSNSSESGLRSSNILFISQYKNRVIVDSFYGDIYKGAQEECKINNYGLLNYTLEGRMESWADLPNVVKDRVVEGVAFGSVVDSTTIETLRTSAIPVVLVNCYLANLEVDCIVPDDVEGGYQATKHLLDLGAREIYVIVPHSSSTSYPDRISGYKKALQERGRKFAERYIQRLEGSYLQVGKIIEQMFQIKPKPEAIFATNDGIAEAVLNVLLTKGVKVPEEMMVVGFDDRRIAEELNPPLTTVRMHREQMGKEAIKRLLSIIKEPRQSALKITCPVELVIRESTRRREGV